MRPHGHYRLRRTTRGVLNPQAKLDPVRVEEIKQRVAAGEAKSAIARELRLDSTTVGRAARGKQWTYPEDER